MKSENKIFLIILSALILALTMINAISIYNSKNNYMSSVTKDIDHYLELKLNGINTNLPEYLIVLDYYQPLDGYHLFFVNKSFDKLYRGEVSFNSTQDKQSYFYLKLNSFSERLISHIKLLIMWDCIIVLVVLFLYYMTVRKLLIRHEGFEKAKEIALFTLNHKLKNYLTGQMINLEILKELQIKSIDRLIESNLKLNKDLDEMFSFIKRYGNGSESKNQDIGVLIHNIVEELSQTYLHKECRISGTTLNIKYTKRDLDFIFFLLLDNAFKYSKTFISIRMMVKGKNKYVIIRNDINRNISSGLGVGLDLVDYLVQKNGFIIRKKQSDKFLIMLRL